MQILTKQQKLFLNNTRKKVGKAVELYNLINPGDKILVAISGGKDSLFLLESLALLKKIIPVNFELKAIYVNVIDAGYKVDINYMQNFCNNLNVPFIVHETKMPNISDSKKSPCFICSWNRRKILFEAVNQLGCNKLALGHHLDDSIETLLLNMINHGNISAIPPSVSMFNNKFQIIRPLILILENNIQKYSDIRNYPSEIFKCQYEETGTRNAVKNMIKEFEKINKNAKINLFRSMSRIDHEYIPPKIKC